MIGRHISKEATILRVRNAAAAGTSDLDSSVVDMTQQGGCQSILFVALLNTVVDGSQLALELYASDASDGSSPTKVAQTATVTAASASNKVLVIEAVWPLKRYIFCRLKRGTANATLDGILAIRHNHTDTNGVTFSDASVLAAVAVNGPALNPATSLLPTV